MGKIVHVPHFNRDAVENASRERDVPKSGIKIFEYFLKDITEESDLENFQAWNKTLILPYTPLKTALSKRENHSTNNAF